MKNNGLKFLNSCLECELRSESFFCNLSGETLQMLDELKVTSLYPKRATIFMEGQPAKGIYILCKGRIKLSTCSQEGKVIILDIVEAGQILGLSATISGLPHIATAEALEPCRIDFVRGKDFLKFLEQNNEAALSALKQMSRSYRAASLHSCSLGLSHSAADKLATLFLSWCKTNNNGFRYNGSYHLKVYYTHEEIAQMIGASRETVTRILSDFSDRNLIVKNGSGIIIPDIKKLESAIGTRQGAGKNNTKS